MAIIKTMSTIRIMWLTNATLLFPIGAAVYLFGIGTLYRLLIAIATVIAMEFLLYYKKNHGKSITDGSALLTGIIIGLSIPPLAPWFIPLSAAIIAIFLGKYCFGGLGNNPFNPAMVGYAICFLAFPQYFQHWLGADGWTSLIAVDGHTAPTPLLADRLNTNADGMFYIFAVASAIGGVVLLTLKIIDWRLPLAFLLGTLLVFSINDSIASLFYGGLVFAAFFVVTDPVTAAVTPLGRLIYAFIVGCLAAWLRENGAHTDGIAFAILAGNMIAPLCDLCTQYYRKQ